MIVPDRSSPYLFSNKSKPSGIGVVIHATRSGVPGNPNEMQGTLNWFNNPASEVSSHWVVGRDGERVRVVPDTEQAWHAREHNATHFGIELCQAVTTDGFTTVQLQKLAELCRSYAQDYGIPIVHAFNGFIGHEETPAGIRDGKTDPGINFPWNDFIPMVIGEVAPTRVWLYGNEQAGLELRGNQQIFWNRWVEVDAIGDYDGNFPGEHWHNQGGQWVKVLP